jgi:hypothetical protein
MQWRRPTRPAAAIVLAVLACVTPAQAQPRVPTAASQAPVLARACATDIDDAGRLISSRVTEPVIRAEAAGVPIAVATDPLIPPGIPHALTVSRHGMCSVEVFNLTVAPALGSPSALAAAFASTAGMPWLGEVDVRDVVTEGDVTTLTTSGGRHDVTSRWTVTVDARGIRDARFETVAFGAGVDGADVHHLEGVTSLPGNRRSWSRDALGVLRIDASIIDDLRASVAERDAAARRAALAVGRQPGDLMQHELDGQVIRFTLGVGGVPVEGVDTAGGLPDRLLHAHRGMGRIYDQYKGWGVRDVWGGSVRTYFGFGTAVPDEVGYINFNSGLSAYCLACAVLGDFIEIHLELNFAEYSDVVLGTRYPDANSLTLEVVGHEFTHALQGGYADGDPGLTRSFTEGTATASQSLFHEAENSAQGGSIEYLDTPNGCEGFENDHESWIAAQAAGPFFFHTYDACYFWWTYLATHGGPGLVRLLDAAPRAQGVEIDERNLHLLDLASPDGDGTVDLAHWAAAYTAGPDGDGYEITDGSGDVHDWLAIMSPAPRARDLGPGDALPVTVRGSGTLGFRIAGDGTLQGLPTGTEAFLYETVDGGLAPLGPAHVGTSVTAGQILAVVGPSFGQYDGTVRIAAS